MSGFIQDDFLRNKKADEPWMKSDTDKMLDEYFAGAHPKRIAQSLARNPKAINRRLEQFIYNERDRAVRYEPFRRIRRKGKRLTQNEILLIKSHRERGVLLIRTANVLQRPVEEIDGSDIKGTLQTNLQKQTAPTLDLIWAHHYIHHRLKKKVISDQAYDDLVKEEVEFGGGQKGMEKVWGSTLYDYPGRIRSLANYLLLTHLWLAHHGLLQG